MLSFAVEEAYTGLLQVKRYPIAVLNISIPYEDVDVNYHPSKREVRFREESRVFSTVQRAVRAVLIADSPVPNLSSPSTLSHDKSVAPYFFTRSAFGRADTENSKPLYQSPLGVGSTELSAPVEPGQPLKIIGQVKLTYVLAEGPSGMLLVDQHLSLIHI